MQRLIIDLGNGYCADIPDTESDEHRNSIISTPSNLREFGDPVTWNVTEGCLEWCSENGVPFEDSCLVGVEVPYSYQFV